MRTLAEVLQIAIDNEQDPIFKEFYRKVYGKLTLKQASLPAGKDLEKNWLERHYPNAVASYGA